MASDQVFGFGFRIWAKNETKRPAEAAAKQMRKVGKAAERAGDEAQRSGRKFRKMGRDGMDPAAKATGNMTRNFLLLAAAATAFFAIRGITSFLKGMVRQAQTTEDQILKLTSIMGSATAGVEAYEFAVRKAAETPFEIDDVVNGFTMLEAFSIDTVKNLDLVGNMAFSMGRSLDEAVGAVTRGTTGMMRALRQQFGVNTLELKKFTKGMAVGSKEYREATLTYLRGIKRFQGGMARAQQSLKVVFSNIGDFFTRMMIKIVGKPGQGGFTDGIKKFLFNMLDTFTAAEKKLTIIMQVIGRVSSAVMGAMSRSFDAAWRPVQRWIDATSDALSDQKKVLLPFLIWLEFTFEKVGRIMRAFADGWSEGRANMKIMNDAIGKFFGRTDEMNTTTEGWEAFAKALGNVAAGATQLAKAFTVLKTAWDGLSSLLNIGGNAIEATAGFVQRALDSQGMGNAGATVGPEPSLPVDKAIYLPGTNPKDYIIIDQLTINVQDLDSAEQLYEVIQQGTQGDGNALNDARVGKVR